MERIKGKNIINELKSFSHDNSSLIILIVLLLFGTIMFPQFLTFNNLLNVLRQSSFNGLIAVGMTLVVLTGGIDLSVGAVFALASVTASLVQNLPVLIMFLIILAICTFVGLINGVIISKLHIAPFIVTLAMMMGVRGVCYILTNGGITKNISNNAFSYIGRGYLFNVIPIPVVILAAVLIIFTYVLKYTSYGRSVYAVGGNYEAAKMMGLSTVRIEISVYAISGLLAGLAGILMASRMASGEPVAGDGYEMNAVSACVLGGALLTGGKARVINSVLGALVLGILNNLMNLQGNMSAQIQNIVMGVVLLIIVITQSGMNKK